MHDDVLFAPRPKSGTDGSHPSICRSSANGVMPILDFQADLPGWPGSGLRSFLPYQWRRSHSINDFLFSSAMGSSPVVVRR